MPETSSGIARCCRESLARWLTARRTSTRKFESTRATSSDAMPLDQFDNFVARRVATSSGLNAGCRKPCPCSSCRHTDSRCWWRRVASRPPHERVSIEIDQVVSRRRQMRPESSRRPVRIAATIRPGFLNQQPGTISRALASAIAAEESPPMFARLDGVRRYPRNLSRNVCAGQQTGMPSAEDDGHFRVSIAHQPAGGDRIADHRSCQHRYAECQHNLRRRVNRRRGNRASSAPSMIIGSKPLHRNEAARLSSPERRPECLAVVRREEQERLCGRRRSARDRPRWLSCWHRPSVWRQETSGSASFFSHSSHGKRVDVMIQPPARRKLIAS